MLVEKRFSFTVRTEAPALWSTTSEQSVPTTLIGTFNQDGFTVTGNSTFFGPVTLTVGRDGTWSFTANQIPDVWNEAQTFTITGRIAPERITGNSRTTWDDGTITLATMNLAYRRP